MAPELRNGEKPSVAADIYALGCICYEMLAGTRVRVKPPRVHPKWDRILARCLDPDPTRRYASIDAVRKAIDWNPWPKVLAVAAGVALAAVTGAATYLRTVTPPETVRLAVLPFETDGPNRALSDGLVNEAAERLRHVKGGRKIRLTVIPLADAAQSKVDRPAKARKLLGATHVLSGAMRWDSGRVTLRALLSDTHSQLPLKEWRSEYAPHDMPNVPVFLAGMVAGTLRLPALAVSTSVNPAAYSDYVKGSGLLQRNDAAGALPLLERAVKADPDSPRTHALLAEAQILEYQLTNDSIWLDRAIASLGEARRRNPDEPEVLVVSAMIHRSLGEYETARDDLSRVLEIEPRNGDALRRLGGVYDDTNHFGEALTAFQRAEDVEPGHIKNHQGLCYVYKHLGNYEEAIPNCQKMVTAVPDSPVAHLALAGVYDEWGRYDVAENESRIALNLDPTSPMALQLLALTLTYQGRYTEAIHYFQRAREAGPPTHLLSLNLGTTYRWAGLPEKANESYREGIRLAEAELAKNSRDAAGRSDTAYMHAWLHEPEQAHSAAFLALEQAPASADVIRMVIMTCVALGENDLAWNLASSASKETIRRLTLDPDLAGFRSSARFERLMASLNIH